MANVVWYWAKNGVQTGPVEWEALRKSAHNGEFGPGDWVWTPGFGNEWKRASFLDALFPPQGAVGDAAKADASGGGSPGDAPRLGEGLAASSAVSARPAGPPAPGDTASPFAEAAMDGRRPETPRTALSLSNAWRNVRLLLFNPFSWRRYAAYAFGALLLMLGAQTATPIGSQFPGLAKRLSDSGLDLSGGIPAFLAKWTAAITQGGMDAAGQETVAAEFSAALRHSAASFSAWMATTPRHLVLSLALLALMAAAAAIHAWFLSRGWAVLLHRVYRRDEPVVRTWADARAPARAIFRGAFSLRFGLLLCWIGAAWLSAARFAAMPDGVPAPDAVLRALFPVAAMGALDAVAMVFARDFAVPRIVLLGSPFWAALRASVSESGFWTLRHMLLLSVVATSCVGLATIVLQPIAALVPILFPVVAAAFFAPYQMLRSLWALDIFFRLHPEARVNVPPRAPLPPEIAAAFAGPRK